MMTFGKVWLPISSNPGDDRCLVAVYHLRDGSVSWFTCPRGDGRVAHKILAVIAVLAPLSSTLFVGSTTQALSRGEQVYITDVFGPVLPFMLPLAAGVAAYVLMQLATACTWRRRCVPCPEPSLQDRKAYATAMVELLLRHNDAAGLNRRYKTPYLNTIMAMLGLLLLIAAMVWLQTGTNTVVNFVGMQIVSSLLAFAVVAVICKIMPLSMVLLRLEKRYTRELDAQRD
ncbi:hypothetical protein [Bifidobacterium crudilactis]|jgi:hypothetical protein|uniref:hypothetical protein n=1 Tax=Bifidobacterium crudilactis TaxID=327277 RepID=UPI002F34F61D